MSIPVTRTKIIVPRRRTDLLTRPRLVDLLYDLLDYKLIVIAAPAGSGKTSLLVDFASQADLPVCWYALDPLDRDPLRFIAHFVAAIAQRFPEFGSRSRAALEASSQSSLQPEALVATIVNEAYEHIQEHFLFVLDDYHLVNEDQNVAAFVNRFVQEVDENCHLVLLSRALLNLSDMPLLVARSQVGGLGFDELAFQAEEFQSLVMQNYRLPMPVSTAEELAEETEGWITGLLLSTQTVWQGMVDRLRTARVAGVDLYDYLAQQVLDQQPPEVRDFLLRSSYLEELDAGLCRAVLGEGEWPALIAYVLQQNLLVLPVGEEGDWIRYHHLFRDFLQVSFNKERPQESEQLLRRLADVYAERGEWDRAHAACARLAEPAALAGLIECAGPELIKSGRAVTLAAWIDALPSELLPDRPGLLSLRGAAVSMTGEAERGLVFLNQAEAALRALEDRPGLVRTLIRRSVTLRFLGKYQAALEDAWGALELAEGAANLQSDRADGHRAMGLSLYLLGRLAEAIDALSRSLDSFTTLGERSLAALVQMELGMAFASAGREGEALAYYRQAREYWRAAGNITGLANLLNNLGVLHYQMGDYEQAAPVFEEALECARQIGSARLEAYILASIGDLYGDLQAADAAIEAFQQARQVARRIKYPFLVFYADLAEALQAHRLGRRAAARRLVDSAWQIAEESASDYQKSLWRLAAGQLHLAEGESTAAAGYFQQASEGFDAGGQKIEAARAHFYLAAARFSGNGSLSASAPPASPPPAFADLERAFARIGALESQHALVISGSQAGVSARRMLEAAAAPPTPVRGAAGLLEEILLFEREIPSLRRRLRPRTAAVPFAPPKLTIQALGRAQVELDGAPVTAAEWQNQKRVRELLFFLLAFPEGLSKESIGVVIWPESSASQLKLQFKNAIYRLRYALGQEVISFEGDRYWFNREQDYQYDVESFLEELAGAGSAARPAEKITALRQALDTYHGDYLPEIGATWVVPFREQYRQKYVAAVLGLANLHLEAGEAGPALEYAQRLLSEDRCLEEAHRLAMLAYAAKGDRAGLTRQFERCRQALIEDMNLEPSPQTIHLFETLRR
jgi:ATP/maltotriose-dependent transcriptional regulator MalT/DNA-binding SARP family transcriptional activator